MYSPRWWLIIPSSNTGASLPQAVMVDWGFLTFITYLGASQLLRFLATRDLLIYKGLKSLPPSLPGYLLMLQYDQLCCIAKAAFFSASYQTPQWIWIKRSQLINAEKQTGLYDRSVPSRTSPADGSKHLHSLWSRAGAGCDRLTRVTCFQK